MVALASNSACAERCSVGCDTRDAGSAACVVYAPLTCSVCVAQWSGYSRHNALILAQAVPCSRAVHTAGSALELKGGNGTAASSLKSSVTAVGGVLAQQLPFMYATLGALRARPPRLPRAAPSLYGGNPQKTPTAEEDAAEEDAAEEDEDEDDEEEEEEEEEEEQEEEEGDADSGGDGDAIKSRKRKTADTVQRRKLELRPKNTEKAYGSNDYHKGPKREWFLFCKAKPGETIFGVVMDEQKPVYTEKVLPHPTPQPHVCPLYTRAPEPSPMFSRCQLTDIHEAESEQALVTPDRVDDYFINYLQKRPQLKKSSKKLDPADPLAIIVNTEVNYGTIRTHRKALADLWKWQKSQYPDEMADIGPPKDSSNWADLLSNFEKGTSNAKRQNYGPRGIQLIKNGYTEDQHVMLCQYGLQQGAPGPTGRQKDAISARVHWNHVWGHTMMMRHDDRTNLQLPDIGIVQVLDLDSTIGPRRPPGPPRPTTAPGAPHPRHRLPRDAPPARHRARGTPPAPPASPRRPTSPLKHS